MQECYSGENTLLPRKKKTSNVSEIVQEAATEVLNNQQT